MKETRKRYSAAFKAKVAIEALQEHKTMAELTHQYGIHGNMINRWKKEFVTRSSEIFETKAVPDDFETEREMLYAKIGELEMEKDWLKKSLKKVGA
jgi:transposase-like protein